MISLFKAELEFLNAVIIGCMKPIEYTDYTVAEDLLFALFEEKKHEEKFNAGRGGRDKMLY